MPIVITKVYFTVNGVELIESTHTLQKSGQDDQVIVVENDRSAYPAEDVTVITEAEYNTLTTQRATDEAQAKADFDTAVASAKTARTTNMAALKAELVALGITGSLIDSLFGTS